MSNEIVEAMQVAWRDAANEPPEGRTPPMQAALRAALEAACVSDNQRTLARSTDAIGPLPRLIRAAYGETP